MNKEELIKEYKNYCSDLNINYKSKSSKNNFIYDYLKHLHNMGVISSNDNFYKIENDIRKVLKEV